MAERGKQQHLFIARDALTAKGPPLPWAGLALAHFRPLVHTAAAHGTPIPTPRTTLTFLLGGTDHVACVAPGMSFSGDRDVSLVDTDCDKT